MKWVKYMAEISSEINKITETGQMAWEEDRTMIPTKDFESPERLYQELITSVQK